MIVDLILQANQHTQRCEELFNLALALFKRIAETSLEFINLEDVARQWTSLLLYGQGSKDVRISNCLVDSVVSTHTFIECWSS